MRIIKRGADEPNLTYKEWRARVLRSQTIFPEIRITSMPRLTEYSKCSKVKNPQSAARGSFFSNKEKNGQKRFNETPKANKFHGNSAA